MVSAVTNYHLGPIRSFADLFCGIGGFHIAAAKFGLKCVYACDIDADARQAYEANFGIVPGSDISKVKAAHIPDVRPALRRVSVSTVFYHRGRARV